MSKFNATTEELNQAATTRKNLIESLVQAQQIPYDDKDLIKWIVSRVSDETLIRKARRSEAETWLNNILNQLEPGTRFTIRGLCQTFNGAKHRHYLPTLLTEMLGARVAVEYGGVTDGLCSTSAGVNIYTVTNLVV